MSALIRLPIEASRRWAFIALGGDWQAQPTLRALRQEA